MPVEGRIHIPIIDYKKCNSCAVCIRGCPAEIIPEYRSEDSSLRGRVYNAIRNTPSLDGVTIDIPPCQQACPIYQDIAGYIKLIANKDYTEAMKLIRETNALPSVTGYVCHHPCEAACIRNLIDQPIAIKALKRFVTDFDNGTLGPFGIKQNDMKISIIGSGPSGLAAAYELAKNGYQVQIIEAFSEPGGMLRWAIPEFRLPRNVLYRDIDYIERMGVVFRTGIKFGKDITYEQLVNEGVVAIILAIGTQQDLNVGLQNERSMQGYYSCLDFLKRYAVDKYVDLGNRLVVIGGGNAAIDVARSGLRCGTREVIIIYHRGRDEMLADKDELNQAEAEGVKIQYLVEPLRIIWNNDKINGLECIRTKLGEYDESGRQRPIKIQGSEFILDATSVISATGQQLDLSWNDGSLPLVLSSRNTIDINDDYLTNVNGVFAAGDAVNGPTTVIEAMASGKMAAQAVQRVLLKKVVA